MIHYSCDMCKRPINIDAENRYVVKIEVAQAIEDSQVVDDNTTDDIDHLEEIQDLLQQIDEHDGLLLDDGVARSLKCDLCEECCKRFLKNPLGLKPSKQLNFSNN